MLSGVRFVCLCSIDRWESGSDPRGVNTICRFAHPGEHSCAEYPTGNWMCLFPSVSLRRLGHKTGWNQFEWKYLPSRGTRSLLKGHPLFYSRRPRSARNLNPTGVKSTRVRRVIHPWPQTTGTICDARAVKKRHIFHIHICRATLMAQAMGDVWWCVGVLFYFLFFFFPPPKFIHIVELLLLGSRLQVGVSFLKLINGNLSFRGLEWTCFTTPSAATHCLCPARWGGGVHHERVMKGGFPSNSFAFVGFYYYILGTFSNIGFT